MAGDQRQKRYRDPYKLVLLKEETLEEVGSYRLTPLNVYILISTLFVITSLIVVAIIFFTPARRLVPGYADVTQNREYMQLYRDIRALEEQVEAQNAYIESFRKIAMGDSTLGAELAALKYERMGNETAVEAAILGSVEQGDASTIEFLYVVSPVSGTVSRGYSVDHPAVDVVAPRNTAVKAILDGYVISSDWTLETGNTIGIQHSNNLVSFYKHNARNLKKLGAYVKAGEAVAIIGNTGELSSGPHLHFELWLDGQPIDPLGYIAFD